MTFDTLQVERMTPEMRREQTRRLLIDAAAAVFGARGYHDASLAEIAGAAGYTTGAIYSNFGSKEDLFLAVVETRRTAMLEQFFNLDSAEDAGRIDAIADVYRQLFTVTDWALWQEFTLYALRNPEVRTKISGDLDLTVSSLTTMLRESNKSRGGGDLPLAEEALARLYIAVFEGIGRQRAIQPDSVSDALFAALVSFIDDSISNRTAGRRTRPDRSSRARVSKP